MAPRLPFFSLARRVASLGGLMAAVTCALICVAEVPALDEKPPELFEDLNDQDVQLTPKQESLLKAIRSEKTTAGVNLVKVNLQVFAAAALDLNMVDDLPIRVTRSSSKSENDRTYWAGKVHASPQDVLLVNRAGNVTGTIQTKKGMFLIRPLGESLHVLIKQDPSKMPRDEPPGFEKKGRQDPPAKKGGLADAVPGVEAKKRNHPSGKGKNDKKGDANLTLDILVAYTPAVDNVQADILGLIDLAETESNQIYQNSQINLTLKVVRSVKVDYTESGSFDTDLARLVGKNDGFMDEIHGIRDLAGADVVVLLINNQQYCGLADAILANADTAFACVHHACATGYYSFAHEIGHLQGARHNLEVDDTDTPFTTGHGYQRPELHDRTVMAYDASGEGLRRLPYFSNPDVTVSGKPMGTSDKNNNTRVLNITAPTVTSFRP